MATKLSTREASEYLSLSESTLRYYRHIGKGPASYLLGRRVFYDVSDLDAWQDAQKAATLRGGVE
jgi:predicted DNA-binding transcriptional regulator AlpA